MYDYLKSDWYILPKRLGKEVLSEPYYDEGGGDALMVTYSQPCYKDINGKKTFIGVAVATADITLNWLVNYFGKLDLFVTGYAFLVSANGTFVVHKHRFYILKESIFSLAEKRKNNNLKQIGGKDVKTGNRICEILFRDS